MLLTGGSIAFVGSPTQASSGGYWMAVSSNSSITLIDGQVDIWAAEVTPDPRSRLLAFDDWTQCNVLGNDSWVIASFTGFWGTTSKNLNLKCGSETTMGYLHIRSGHESQWRNRLTQSGYTGSTDEWDDLMWGSAEVAWKDPDVTKILGQGKVCRSASMQMYLVYPNGYREYKYTFSPTFIWSMTNNLLITAIPSSQPTC